MSVLPEIEREYVESGKAKFEAKPIAILGEESVLAAAGAECANDQDRYWEFHDILFANQGREGSGAFSADNLKRFAEALSLDTAAFNTCLDTAKYESQVQAATQESRADGVKVTPTVLVNGEGVDPTIDAIKAAIETALAGGS